jgi:hypothetical protein
MSKVSHAGHNVHGIHKFFHSVHDGLAPLKKRRDPTAAFFIGLTLGAFGLGPYLGSWKDFFICLGAVLFFALVLAPTMVGEVFTLPLSWLFAACYGTVRVHGSNERLANGGQLRLGV